MGPDLHRRSRHVRLRLADAIGEASGEVVMVPAKLAPDFVRKDAGEGTRTLMPAEADT